MKEKDKKHCYFCQREGENIGGIILCSNCEKIVFDNLSKRQIPKGIRSMFLRK